MSNPIRVLILEDRAADAELMLHELRQAGFDPDWQIVVIEPDYLTALETNPDLILADWSLPQFNGLRALQLMNERGLDIPFVIVSGSIGEEVAVEAIHQGAADYLLKDRLTRLGQAVRRALEDKQRREERKRAEEQLRESEAMLAKAQEIGRMGNWKWNIATNEAIWSEEVYKLYGLDPEKDRPDYDVVINTLTPECKDDFLKAIEDALNGRKLFEGEYSIIRPDGTRRYSHTRGEVLRDIKGNPTGMFGIVQDITERKRTEEAQKKAENDYRLLAENSPDLIARFDPQLRHLYVNQAAAQAGRLPASEYIGKTIIETGVPEPVARVWEERISQVLKTGEMTDVVETFPTPGGDRYFHTRLAPELASDGSVQSVLSLARDITERKQAEEALRESEQRLATLISNLPGFVYRCANDRNWTTKFISEGCRDITGYAPEDFLENKKLAYNDIIRPDYREPVWLKWQTCLENKIAFEAEYPIITALDEARWLWERGRGIYSEDGRLLFLEGFITDITERKRVEEALRESEERVTKAFRSIPEALVISRLEDGKIVEVNDSWHKVFGYSRKEVIGKSSHALNLFVDSAERERAMSLLREQGFVRDFEPQIRQKSGALRTAILSVDLLEIHGEQYMLSVVQDISERKRAEEEIRQLNNELEQRVEERTRELHDAQEQVVRQEKLAVLGQLAGGVGHELRNPLGIINNAIYYLKLVQPDANEKVREYQAMIEQEVHTAEKIITDLLDFARIESMEREPVSVPELVQRVLIRYPVPESVTAALKLPANLPTVFADPRQMEQVLGNLVVNACQAMPKGGKLTISVHRKKEMVAIAVKDTGVGIPPENMKKLFEPLFTTKAKGIGLGLAVSQRLAEANGGRIEVQSEPGKGSTFTLYLPVGSQ